MNSIDRVCVIGLVSLSMTCGTEASNDATPVAARGGLEIYSAYAPASPAPDIGSLYFTVVNAGALSDTLTEVRTDAGLAMLHEMVMEKGLSTMQQVSAIAIAVGDTLRLVPGSYHVMLSQLPRPLEVGDTVSVSLQFTRTGLLTFNAAVLTYTAVVERLESGHLRR